MGFFQLRSGVQTRDLSDPARLALYARHRVRVALADTVRRAWWLLLALAITPPAAVTWLALGTHGAVRGALFGIAGTTGVALAAVTAVIVSGVGNPWMGAAAESWTAKELRRLRRHNCHVIHGLRIRGLADIDHIVVCPNMVLVVENEVEQ
jgi:hypothetical protein